jgi:hypothetical protein
MAVRTELGKASTYTRTAAGVKPKNGAGQGAMAARRRGPDNFGSR